MSMNSMPYRWPLVALRTTNCSSLGASGTSSNVVHHDFVTIA
jgi:hypothetical protein